MNETSMTESPEPVEPGVPAPAEPTSPGEVPLNAAPGTMLDSSGDVSAGESVDAAPVNDALVSRIDTKFPGIRRVRRAFPPGVHASTA